MQQPDPRLTPLMRTMTAAGNFLFRWRSYVILGFVPLFLVALTHHPAGGTALSLAVANGVEGLAILLVLAGLGFRILTVGFAPAGTSGRNTKGQAADALNTTGAYSMCRNPLYLANCTIYVGIALFTRDPNLTFAMLFFLVAYYERIILAEERFLVDRFGSKYLEWAERTPAIVPDWSLYRKPELPFSTRSVLRREYPGWLAAALVLSVCDVLEDSFSAGHLVIEPAWVTLSALAGAVFMTLFVLKKRTGLLNAPGR